jgi:O-succinylbenzoic acid--CoA ligase
MTQAQSRANLAQDFLILRAARSPASLALRTGGQDVTYGELDELAALAAGSLREAGVGPGDRIAAVLPSGLAFVVLLHAVLRLGAAIVPLNTRLRPAELRAELLDARPRLLVTGGPRQADATQLAAELGLPLWLLPEAPYERGPLLAGPPAAGGPLDERAVAAIVYTSGTTGTPKGAMLSRRNFFYAAVSSAMGLGALPDDRWLLCMPLFHVGGLSIIVRSTLFGGAVLAQDGFDVLAVRKGLWDEGATCVSLVPVMLDRLISAGVAPPPTLRFALLGGAAASGDLVPRAQDLGWPVAPTYGLTETASQAATLPPREAKGRPGSAGKPLFLTEVRIEKDGRAASPGEPGEILVKGPTVIEGYLGRPEEFRERFLDGYLRTGDIGYLDRDGYLYVLDRRDDLIVSGGENVYPAEVEAVFCRHPDVADAAVYGVTDSTWGEVPAAAIVPRAGASPAAAELLAFASEGLAGYKLPRSIRFVSSLPRNAGGKLMRRALREEGQDG